MIGSGQESKRDDSRAGPRRWPGPTAATLSIAFHGMVGALLATFAFVPPSGAPAPAPDVTSVTLVGDPGALAALVATWTPAVSPAAEPAPQPASSERPESDAAPTAEPVDHQADEPQTDPTAPDPSDAASDPSPPRSSDPTAQRPRPRPTAIASATQTTPRPAATVAATQQRSAQAASGAGGADAPAAGQQAPITGDPRVAARAEQAWAVQVQRALQRGMARARRLGAPAGTVVLALSVAPDGRVLSASVGRSSGHADLDAAALDALAALGRLPRAPGALRAPAYAFEAPVVWRPR